MGVDSAEDHIERATGDQGVPQIIPLRQQMATDG